MSVSRVRAANAADGFDTVRRQIFTPRAGERRDAPNLIILITDSNANVDAHRTIQAVERLKGEHLPFLAPNFQSFILLLPFFTFIKGKIL